MKTLLAFSGVLAMFLALACVATGISLVMAGLSHPQFGVHIHGIPNPFAAALSLFIAAVAIVFAVAVTVVALAGAFLAVVLALLVTGLILLAVALPFLLPFLLPLILILAVVLATRQTGRTRTI